MARSWHGMILRLSGRRYVARRFGDRFGQANWRGSRRRIEGFASGEQRDGARLGMASRGNGRRDDVGSVKLPEIDRNALGNQPGQQPEHGGKRLLSGQAGGARPVRTITENLADHAAARSARADFNENADAIEIGAFDERGKVERLQRLSDDGIGGTLARRFIRAALGAAVKANVRRRRGS